MYVNNKLYMIYIDDKMYNLKIFIYKFDTIRKNFRR